MVADVAPIRLVVDGQEAILPRLSITLPDGRTGWYQRSQWDCMRAAIATATQVPYEDVGDVSTLRDVHAWAEARDLRVQMHFGPPNVAQWIGLSPLLPPHGLRHTIVGAYDGLYFDPASGWVFPGGLSAPPTNEMEYAISLEPMEAPLAPCP